jgi:hypothetical protein
MRTASPWSGALQGVLRQPTNGIAGLVDNLLAVCREHSLHLDWQTDRCRVRSVAEDWHEVPDVPLRKSVLRAILARLAVLCNERRPGSCSPYGGQGEIAVGSNPSTVFRVVFTNTPTEQRLELTPGGSIMSTEPDPAAKGHPMLDALLAAVPRLRSWELKGWSEGHLVPALAGFHDGATDGQVITALKNLRDVLRARADVDPWLGDIAERGIGEFVGALRDGGPPAEHRGSKELPSKPIGNRTIILQVRKLAESLIRIEPKADDDAEPSPSSNPDAK